MGITTRINNSLCACGLFPDYLSFTSHLADCSDVQRHKLSKCLDKNKDTSFGREHRFGAISSIEEYQNEVPLREYGDFTQYIDRISNGEKNVLTYDEVTLLEPTGGTSSGSKLIPYTKSLKKEFQKALNPWVFDLYRNIEGLTSGKSYWSITPITAGKEYTQGGIPIGFEDDSDYLGFTGRFLRSILCVPPEVKNVRNLENFRYVTGLFLLASHDLALISVWNPSFLTLLLEYIERHHDKLIRDIHDGKLRLPIASEGDFHHFSLHPLHARARRIDAALQKNYEKKFTEIWNRLRIISCWSEGMSSVHAQKISEMFPGVYIQPKGLLATEGVVSFPLEDARGSVVAYQSHFLEFLPEGDHTPRLLHQLDQGAIYTIILTTGGGLYRYNLKDKVQVTGRYRGLPIVRFHERSSVSDIVGEKLEEGHVQRVIEGVLRNHEVTFEFVLFAPEIDPCGGYYTLFIEPKDPCLCSKKEALLREIDEKLMENFHYKYARDLGQLLGPEIFIVKQGSGQEAFIRRCTESGQRLGDIKQGLLDRRTGWKSFLSPSEGVERHPLQGLARNVQMQGARNHEE